MSKQHQIHEESYQTGDSDSDEQGEEDGEEEEEDDGAELEIDLRSKQVDVSTNQHRRGKSMHLKSSSRPSNAGGSKTTEKEKKSLKNTITKAFRNFF